MDSPASPSFDLALAESWRGLSPGMARAAVLDLLPEEIRLEADDEADSEWVIIKEWGLDLFFAEEGEQRLRQLVLNDESWHWRGQPILEAPLHEALAALGDSARAAGWRPENPLDELPGYDLEPPKAGPYEDERLLASGTLWLPALRMGLTMENGKVEQLAWRDVQDMPRVTVAGVTAQQLAISARPDAENYLRSWTPPSSKPPAAWLQTLLTFVWVLALVGILVAGLRERQRWTAAPRAKARVMEIGRPLTSVNDQLFVVEFADEKGQAHRVPLPGSDFNLPPAEVGEEVEVTYLPPEPLQVVGPAGLRDAGFFRYAPWAAGVTVGYFILSGLVIILSRVGRWAAQR